MDTLTAAPAPPVRGHPTLWLLRLFVSALLLAVVVQPVLAGHFLTGDVDAIVVHSAIGGTLALGCLLVTAAALLYVLAGRGRLWVLPVMVAMFVAVVTQISTGHARSLDLHIPLGVAITLAATLLAVWVWSPSAARRRGSRR